MACSEATERLDVRLLFQQFVTERRIELAAHRYLDFAIGKILRQDGNVGLELRRLVRVMSSRTSMGCSPCAFAFFESESVAFAITDDWMTYAAKIENPSKKCHKKMSH